MWFPKQQSRGLYTISRLIIIKGKYEIKKELEHIGFTSSDDWRIFNETVERQIAEEDSEYNKNSIILLDRDGIERVAPRGVCRNLATVVNCKLVFDTGLFFANGDQLKACLGIYQNRNRQNRDYPYVADIIWQSWGDAGRKNIVPACVANIDDIAKIVACIYGGVEKTAREAIRYAFLTQPTEDDNVENVWVALIKRDIKLSFDKSDEDSGFPCYVINAQALRQDPSCPAIYRTLKIALGLLRNPSILEKLQRLLPDMDARVPCGWNHWVEKEESFLCDRPAGSSLAYYLEGVLERLCLDRDADSNASGTFADDTNGPGFWFCTGLIGRAGCFIYGHICKPDDDGFYQYIEWHMGNDKPLPSQHPAPPNWTRSAQELVYNRDLLAKIVLRDAVQHVYNKHRERFPREWRSLPFDTILDYANRAFNQMCLEAYGNYRIIIPAFYKGRVSLLLPLRLGDSSESRTNAYLVVTNEGTRYQAWTIYTPSMAFYAARIVTPQATLEWEQNFFAPLRAALHQVQEESSFSFNGEWEANQLKELLEASK